MKKWLFGLIVFVAPLLHAQVRWEYVAFTTGNATTGGPTPQTPMLSLPGATITLCGYVTPGGACTVPVTTYTTALGSGTCPTNQPLTRSTQPGCFSVADSKGNFGMWITAGQTFGYTVVTSFGTFGPFAATAPGGGGGSLPNPLFTLGTTPIVASTTAASITGLTVNGVFLTNGGPTTNFLNQTGSYAALPTGSSSQLGLLQCGSGTTCSAGTISVSGGGGSGTVTSVDVNTANGVSATGGPITGSGAFTFTLGAITPSQVTTGFVTTTGNAACTGCGGGDTLTEGTAPSGSFIGAGLDTYWADSATHHIAANLNNGGTSYIPSIPVVGTPGDLVIFGSDGIILGDGGVPPTGNISGGVTGFLPLFGSTTTITGPSHVDDGVTTAGVITSSEPVSISSSSLPPGVIIIPNTVAPAAPASGFMWGVPTAIATAYTAVVPSAAPTSGNNFLSCTAANPAICTWAAAGGTPSFPVTVAGTVNSGGIPYFNSTTQESSSATGTINTLIAWGGAGAAPFASHVTDNTTNMTSSITLIGPAGSATVCGICVSTNAFGLAGVSGNMMVIQSSVTRFGVTSTGIDLSSNVLGMGTSFTSNDTGLSRVSAGVVGVGTGAAGSVAGTIQAAAATIPTVNGTTIPTSATLTQTIASGTLALGTSAIASGACATVATATATGTASTDSIIWNPNASIKAVTGYTPATTGGLTIALFPSTNLVSADVCNWSTASITPGAVTLNWRVTR